MVNPQFAGFPPQRARLLVQRPHIHPPVRQHDPALAGTLPPRRLPFRHQPGAGRLQRLVPMHHSGRLISPAPPPCVPSPVPASPPAATPPAAGECRTAPPPRPAPPPPGTQHPPRSPAAARDRPPTPPWPRPSVPP